MKPELKIVTAENAVAHASPAPQEPDTIPLSKTELNRILLSILIVSGFAELAYGIVNISAMPVYIKAIGLDSRWIGIIAAGYLISEGLLKSPFGLLGDRIGRKPLMLAGPLVSTVTALLTPFTHNPYLLIVLRVLDGMGLAALWPAAFSMIGDYVPAERRASAMSLFNVAYLIALALGPAIGGSINDFALNHFHLTLSTSKEASFYVSALLFAATVGVAFLTIPGRRISAVHAPDSVSAEGKGISLRDFVAMLGRMPVLLAVAFVTFLGVGMIMAYTKIYLMDVLQISESKFGTLLIGPALAVAVASVPLGKLGDKLGKATASKIGIGLCMFAYWCIILFTRETTLMVMGSVIGIGFVIAFPALMAQVSEAAPPGQRGAAVGALGTAQGIGAIFGVVSSGFLYKQHGFSLIGFPVPKHGLPFLICGLLLTVSFLFTLFGMHDGKASDQGLATRD